MTARRIVSLPKQVTSRFETSHLKGRAPDACAKVFLEVPRFGADHEELMVLVSDTVESSPPHSRRKRPSLLTGLSLERVVKSTRSDHHWQLTVEALKRWGEIGTAKKHARRNRDSVRLERLNKLRARAWKQFTRRWFLAKQFESSDEHQRQASDGV
jgi:hypothetical protein